jgi:hypothetical protein
MRGRSYTGGFLNVSIMDRLRNSSEQCGLTMACVVPDIASKRGFASSLNGLIILIRA